MEKAKFNRLALRWDIRAPEEAGGVAFVSVHTRFRLRMRRFEKLAPIKVCLGEPNVVKSI